MRKGVRRLVKLRMQGGFKTARGLFEGTELYHECISTMFFFFSRLLAEALALQG